MPLPGTLGEGCRWTLSWRWGELGGDTQRQVVLDLGRQVAGTPLLPVLEEVNQGPGAQGEA